MKQFKFRILLITALWLAVGAFVSSIAQDTPSLTTEGTENTEGGGGPGGQNPVGWAGLVALIVPALIGMFKSKVPERFRKWLPIAAPIIGEILTQVFTSLPNGAGGLGGLAGVGVREAVKRKQPTEDDKYTGKDPRADGYVRLIILGFAVLFFTGCAALADKVTRPVVAAQTNVVTQVVTNFVPVAVRVPGETVTVTNVVRELVTNTVERVEFKTNYVVNPAVAEGLQVARTGAAVGGAFNPGAGAIASGVLGLAAAGLGWMVRRKNNEAFDARAEAESLALQLQAAIEGVEKAGGVIKPEDAAKVKETISKVSQALGVAEELHTSVQVITKS